MAISFNKIFKKADSTQPKVGKEQASEQSQQQSQEKKKKSKHDEPGFCCGSCSQ